MSNMTVPTDDVLRATKAAASAIPVAGPWITNLEVSYVTDAVKNGWYAHASNYVDRFEQAFCAFVGVRYAVSVSHCTSAIHLALLAKDIGPGDEVLVPELTWIASAAPVSHVGATPVFVDVDQRNWCISADSIQARISSQTKAIIVVDLYGNLPAWEPILELARKHDLTIIEDAAEAFGSEYRGKKAGALGDIGVFSFHGSKTLTTGEGGMLVTNDRHVYERVLSLRDHGRLPGDTSFLNREVAYKYRMSNIQAALGLAQVERREEIVRRKRDIFQSYAAAFEDTPDIQLNAEVAGTKNSYWMTTAVIDAELDLRKEQVGQELRARGIDTRPVFYPLSSLPAYRDLPSALRARRVNHNAYRISPWGINLPSALNLTDEQIERVAGELKSLVLARRIRSVL